MEITIMFPAICPQCGKEALDEYPVAEVAVALLSETPLRLYARCHYYHWVASESEREHIRQYLGAACGDPETAAAHGRSKPAIIRR